MNLREVRCVVTAPTLGLLLVDAPAVVLDQVRAELGPQMVEGLMALGQGRIREYHRLIAVGVTHTTAAVLAAHHREAG